MTKRTSGDVFRINITPAADSFPWVRIFRHPYGIRKAGRELSGTDARKGKSKRKVALEIGEQIIHNSKVLSAWFK